MRLSDTQAEIVRHGDGPLLVVAGPGSGKTRVLTERVRRLLQTAEGRFRILALTFTNKAANEMKERLAEFPAVNELAFIGTIHGFCAEVLAERGKWVGVDGPPAIFEAQQDRREVLLVAVQEDRALQEEINALPNVQARLRLLDSWLSMISEAKNHLLTPEMLQAGNDRRVYEGYERGLRASGAVDFDDLLLLTYRLFVERPKIADFYRRLYSYVCIDEAQDLNEAQYQLIRALTGPEYRNVMMVGDPKQAIFAWNGADPKYLKLFERDFGARKIPLSENFRSSRAVVEAACSLVPEYTLEGQLPVAGAADLLKGRDEREEADRVLSHLQWLLDEGHDDIEGRITLQRCALLARSRYALSAVEEKLVQLQWPFYKQLTAQHESESDLMLDFGLGLRLLSNPQDQLHLGMLRARWQLPEDKRGQDGWEARSAGIEQELVTTLVQQVSKPDQRAVLEAVQILRRQGGELAFMKALDHLQTFAAKQMVPEARALVMSDAETWKSHWNCYVRSQPSGRRSLTSFLGQVALGTTQQQDQEGLALLTIHSAKGLEFDVVIVMGMVEGILPDYRAQGNALLEEKRSAFVAVTRSRRLVALSYPETRIMPWGEIKQCIPSRFIRGMGLL